ncbi:Mme1p Ecym_5632 [Eremothecium cymbalariae DBVPG|uniref:Mitochondrial carrier protein n=1 Tax=Eremothecium cymbalariae (strain CBS 270.75 / DBVPG 7215 / KCTC 17166 / NRRL Y-17582) TaxID=931890 RepID=I6NE76_ERECY|nr:hypothetical protein Ecym_5632 [Eremothecium cymbalariae DBVPG\
MLHFTSSIPVVGTHHDNYPHTPGDHGAPSHGGSGSASGTDRAEYNPVLQCIVAGGVGGAIGDSAMYSLDTVKTRQQGAPSVVKYRNMAIAYRSIALEEGFRRGLYGGYAAAMLGSFPSAAIFFGTYEYIKREMIEKWQVNETTTHLIAGFLGDLVSSVVYVPSEVLKTRLQLQGRYNNAHFNSGYNYRHLRHAVFTIVKNEGPQTLFFGYKATLVRDLPFSALQFAFYEKFRKWAFSIEGKPLDKDLSISSEIVAGALAGGLGGVITTPLDVIKTRLQTQIPNSTANLNGIPQLNSVKPLRLSSSILSGMLVVYKTEGISGIFSGVGPRFIWTSIQSSIMLLLYQTTLKALDNYGLSKKLT